MDLLKKILQMASSLYFVANPKMGKCPKIGQNTPKFANLQRRYAVSQAELFKKLYTDHLLKVAKTYYFSYFIPKIGEIPIVGLNALKYRLQ